MWKAHYDMMILVKVNGKDGAIIGYGPGEHGQPKAIVVIDGGLLAVALSDIELVSVPKKLQRKVEKSHRRQRKAAAAQVTSATIKAVQ